MVLIAVLVLALGLPSGEARAAVDVRIMASPGSTAAAAKEFRLRDGGVLRSGDGVQLRLGSDADAYVYVVAYGSSHTAMLLHPFSAKPKDALVRGGRKEVIPAAGVFLPLDDQEGQETLFTIVSDVPLKDIPDLLPRIEAHGDDLSAITDMIKAAYPSVRRLSFKHIGARPLVGIGAATRRATPSFETPDATPENEFGGDDPQRGGGVSLLPPAGSGWTVPSTQGFATSEDAAATAKVSASPQASPAVKESAPSGDGVGAVAVIPAAVGESAAASASASASVSPALLKAREAAGIDELQFRGILAKLPGGGEAALPESARKPYKEQGVLGAEGSRIRALGSAQLESGASRNNLQN